MASAVHAPISSICAEKQHLTDALVDTVRILSLLHEQEMGDLANGGTADRFDLAITLARRRRRHAMRALVNHLREHGC